MLFFRPTGCYNYNKFCPVGRRLTDVRVSAKLCFAKVHNRQTFAQGAALNTPGHRLIDAQRTFGAQFIIPFLQLIPQILNPALLSQPT
jgi:hypothetical protein